MIGMSDNKHNIEVFYKIMKKYNEIQLTKNKMDLNNRKMNNHPPSPMIVEPSRWPSVWLLLVFCF